ncbi:MAG: lipopolysaccharide biosynthesis protein [Solirubrobacteraceae bacterium]
MTDPPSERPGLIARLLRLVRAGDGASGTLAQLRGSDTAKAAGLAGAMIANNLIALVSTIVFARLLKDNQGGGYGALAALISYFLILSVVGQALQVATAREGALGELGVGHGLVDTVRRWTRGLLLFTLVLTVVSVLARVPIAAAVGVKQDPWAAALGLPAAGLWLELSVLRGVLQGAGDYKGVGLSLIGEQAARLITGAILAAAGLGVAGAYLGTPLSFIAMGLYCAYRLRRHVRELEAVSHGTADAAGTAPGLWTHVRRAWAPIWGLIVIAVLQNIDIIAAKHRFGTHVDSSYAAVAVAAKVLIWVAMGAGFYLVPEVSRRRSEGEDPRPILVRALGIVGVCAIPVLAIYAFANHTLIKLAFGASKTQAAGSLLVLGLAFAVLACTYLAVQYLLAMRRTWFLAAVSVVAIAEPIFLLNASHKPTSFAAVVLAIQAVGALVAFGFALAPDRAPRPPEPREPPEDPDRPLGPGSRRVPEPV